MSRPTVAKMIEELQKYPQDAVCHAYEGEVIGLVITSKDGDQLGYIDTAREWDEEPE
jgi:hypothetical protein